MSSLVRAHYVGQGAVPGLLGDTPIIIMDKVMMPFHHDIEGLGSQIQQIVFLINSCSIDIFWVTFMSVYGHHWKINVMQYNMLKKMM
jgi:hypothetical protein